MKKSLFSALIAIVALVFVGCEPQNDPNKLTGISVAPAELAMVPGKEFRLSVAPTPSTATLDATVAVVWESSDTTVAVVNDKGVVTAVGYGKANVTATYGEFKGVCAVWVKTYYENLSFTQAILWSMDTTAFGGEVYEITTSDGSETFNCYLALGLLRVFSDGLYVDESGYINGVEEGSYIELQAPMWYGTKYLNPEKGGVQFSLGPWSIAEVDTIVIKNGDPGLLNTDYYMAYMNMALEYYNAGDSKMFSTALAYAGGYDPRSVSGSVMNSLVYEVDETGAGGYYGSYIPDGLITLGQFSLSKENAASAFMCSLEYNQFEFLPFANDETYTWGCNWLFNEDGTLSWGDEMVMHWGEKITYQLGELPTAETMKMEPLYAPVMTIDYPEIAERIEKQLKQRNTLVKK